MNGVSSHRHAWCCTTNQEHWCSLEKDGVRCSADHIVAKSAGIAHRQILFISSDVGCRADTRFPVYESARVEFGRQVNNESRSERLCGLETFFQLGINRRALNDQIALTWGQPEGDSVVWLDPRRPHGELSDGRPLFLAPGTSAANRHRPVPEHQPLHAAEFSSVVCDEPEPKRARVSGDEEVIGSDHLAAPL